MQVSFEKTLESIWFKGVAAYRSGIRTADAMFDEQDVHFLKTIGQTTQEFFDYAEDYVRGGDPDFPDVLAVAFIRKDYFEHRQNSIASDFRVIPDSLPPKAEELKGIVWLPRIIIKAHAKLRGELPPEIMYGCGGDRRFFKENNVTAAEFLAASLVYEGSPDKLWSWVKSRRDRIAD
ncbi:MAG: DUF5069 domain-containing protein [Opitutales bacterium]|nr:DUF5069 domain-containing protein [Opitutales bacterium]